jgi:hypothetical protein
MRSWPRASSWPRAAPVALAGCSGRDVRVAPGLPRSIATRGSLQQGVRQVCARLRRARRVRSRGLQRGRRAAMLRVPLAALTRGSKHAVRRFQCADRQLAGAWARAGRDSPASVRLGAARPRGARTRWARSTVSARAGPRSRGSRTRHRACCRTRRSVAWPCCPPGAPKHGRTRDRVRARARARVRVKLAKMRTGLET